MAGESCRFALLALLALAVGVPAGGLPDAARAPERVAFARVPDGGYQPQAVLDREGRLHLVYLKGEFAASDVYYVRWEGDRFTPPLRVNSQPGSAIGAGVIRGAQLAVGRGGRVHVVWNGSNRAQPRGPLNPDMPAESPYNGSPFLYSRLDDAGAAFEPQRNLMQHSWALDGGGSVAADEAGRVYVSWHAGSVPGGGERARQLFVAVSTDDGRTFSREAPAFSEPVGACACCGTRNFLDRQDNLLLFFRSAKEGVDRDTYLLVSRDRGRTFQGTLVDRWRLNACPMSIFTFAESAAGLVGAWETQGQVYFARLDPATLRVGERVPAPGQANNRKHPAVSINDRGEVLLAWVDGAGHNRGGTLMWQLYDAEHRPTVARGRVLNGIPPQGLPTAVARPDGNFFIVH